MIMMIGLVTWILTQDTEENVSCFRSPLDVGFCDDAILRKDEEQTLTQVFMDSRLFFQVLLNRHLAAIALVLSWAEMITLIGEQISEHRNIRRSKTS